MSADQGKMCSVLLKQHFGSTVQMVGDCLFAATARTIASIAQAVNLSRGKVRHSLAILGKHQLVSYEQVQPNSRICEYKLEREEVIFMLRYSSAFQYILSKYGNASALIVEEIIFAGCQTASNVILCCMKKNPEKPEDVESLMNAFLILIEAQLLRRVPQFKRHAEKRTDDDPPKTFEPPEINVHQLAKALNDKQQCDSRVAANTFGDKDIYWRLNTSRFQNAFRDELMVNAIERRHGTRAGEYMSAALEIIATRTEKWQRPTSTPFTKIDVMQFMQKNWKSTDYLDDYLVLIAEDSLGFLREVDNCGTGISYVAELEHGFERLALCCIENIIAARFGLKAARIFRVIHIKKFIEEDNLQREAMISTKEAKFISYSLFQAQFISIRVIRKVGGGGGQSKTFYLYHVNLKQVVKMLLETCYKAVHNSMTRANHELNTNQRLLDKCDKVDKVLTKFKSSNATKEQIKEMEEIITPTERRMQTKYLRQQIQLMQAGMSVDDTMLIFEMYLWHSSAPDLVPTKKSKDNATC